MTPSNNSSNPSPRVVVVNDDATQLNVLCGLLYKAGLEALAFKNAESALAAMAQNLQPDLIVSDVYMPGIDGWRFCRLLRSREYERFNQTPILVVSATFSGDEPSRITADLGANAFLSMPVDGQQFIKQVQMLLMGENPQAVLKALIVEDSKLVSKRIVDAFRAQGYQAHAALTLQEALSLLDQNSYDIAVMDYHLPDGLGDDLLHVLQQKTPECVCMMMTADPQPELALTWMKMGAAAYLHKPFEPEYLIELCERARRERALLRSQDLLELRTRQLQEAKAVQQEALDRLQKISSRVPGVVYQYQLRPDGSSCFPFASEAIKEIYRVTPEEVRADASKIFANFHPDDYASVAASIQASAQNLSPWQHEYRVKFDDGTIRFLYGNAVPQREPDGSTLWHGFITDITERKQSEDALQESETRFRVMADSAPVLIWMSGPDALCNHFNKPWLDFTGRTMAQELGNGWTKGVHPDDYQNCLDIYTGAFKAQHEFKMEYRLRRADGEYRLLIDNGVPRFTPDGIFLGFIGTCVDITERKQAEQALLDSEERYRTVVEWLPEAIVVHRGGKLIYVNSTAIEMFGARSAQELLGKPILDLIHPDFHQIVLARVKNIVEDGLNAPLAEMRYLKLDGSPIDVDIQAISIIFDGAQANLAAIRDITARKRTDQALRESEEKYRRVFDNAYLGIFQTTPEGKPISVNSAFAHMFGYDSPEEAMSSIKNAALDIFADPNRRAEIIRMTAENPDLRTFENVYRRKDGSTFVGNLNAMPIRDSQGRLIRTEGIIEDISARKQAEHTLREEENLLKRLASFTEELLKAGPEQITYQKILENLLIISKAKYGAFTLLNESTGKYTTVAVAGLNENVKKIATMLGFEPVGKEWNDYSTENEKLKDKVVTRFSSMSDLARRVIPEMISRPIEKLINMGEVTVTKVIVNHQMIGDFTLIMPAGKKFENDTFVEIYSRQIDMFMTRKLTDEKLKESEEKYRSLIENSHDIIVTGTTDGVFTFVSPAWTALLGHPLTQVVGKAFQEFVHPDDLAGCMAWLKTIIETGQRQGGFEYRVQHVDGSWRWHTARVVPLWDQAGDIVGFEGTTHDITERKHTEAELSRAQDELESAHRELQQSFAREQALARIDDLTGINNHRSLLQLAGREFQVAMRYRPPLSMMFFDIDHFKQINDTFGHLMGDQALKKMIDLVSAEIRSADVIGRYGGDEFVILMPQTSAQEALPFAERIHASIANLRLDTDKGPLTLTISIGIAQTIHESTPESGQADTVENLLLRADQALYAAKEAGRNRTVVFDSI